VCLGTPVLLHTVCNVTDSWEKSLGSDVRLIFIACVAAAEGQIVTEMLRWTIAAVVLSAVAGYAQVEIARYTAGTTRVALTRAVLIIVGIAVGYVARGPLLMAKTPRHGLFF
jgi:hypothetical protein